MGDSGALVIGFTISVLSILFVNSIWENNQVGTTIYHPAGAVVVTLSVLFIPIFDSFRVFIARIMKGKHPFHADRTHIHHFLLDIGFSHSHTVSTLLTANFLVITIALFVQNLNPNFALGILLLVTMLLFCVLYYMRKNRLAEMERIKEELAIKAQQIPLEKLMIEGEI